MWKPGPTLVCHWGNDTLIEGCKSSHRTEVTVEEPPLTSDYVIFVSFFSQLPGHLVLIKRPKHNVQAFWSISTLEVECFSSL